MCSAPAAPTDAPREQSVAWEEIKARASARAARRLQPVIGRRAAGAARADARLQAQQAGGARRALISSTPSQTADKVAEELAEVREAAAHERAADGDRPRYRRGSREIFEEIGDLLFAAANLARKLDVDAEAALRAANAKFERRFRGMESLAAQRGEIFADLNLAAQERLWQEVKRGE